MLKVLVDGYVELNKINAEPGEKSHAIWNSTDFIKRTIKDIVNSEIKLRKEDDDKESNSSKR